MMLLGQVHLHECLPSGTRDGQYLSLAVFPHDWGLSGRLCTCILVRIPTMWSLRSATWFSPAFHMVSIGVFLAVSLLVALHESRTSVSLFVFLAVSFSGVPYGIHHCLLCGFLVGALCWPVSSLHFLCTRRNIAASRR